MQEVFEKNWYIKAIDDAIEKFLEYGCFCIEWNPKLSKEKLVDDVMRQVRGQSVYILEKLKQKAEEYNQSLANNNQSLTNDGWIPCSERLPEEEYDTVLAVTDKNHYCVAVYTTEYGFRTMDIDCEGDFVAWQPLPEPYRGE